MAPEHINGGKDKSYDANQADLYISATQLQLA